MAGAHTLAETERQVNERLAGMTIDEEYQLLTLHLEMQRLEFLRRYLKKAHHVAQGLENLREKLKLNGHFRNLSGFDFGEK